MVLNPLISRNGISMKTRNIYKWSQERGYRIGIGGIDLLKNVKEELEQRKTRREIEPDFFEEYLSFIRDLNDVEIKHPSSLIIVAVPRPAHIVSFELDEKIIEMILPPTYMGYRRLFETIRQDLEKHVFAGQVQATTLSAPLKALASLLGVVSYGRNNIAYIPEFGSYFQLAGFLVETQIPKTELNENNVKPVLSECTNCRACIKVCPMGVINQDRFLIHAEKCYTLYSESISPIPSDIRAPSPDCIIGCMKCQMVCPVNKGRLKYKNTGVSFSSKETRAILSSSLMNPKLSESIEAKFSTLALSEGSDILFRNFRNLMLNFPSKENKTKKRD
jgi:epoxyqueuosine reductase